MNKGQNAYPGREIGIVEEKMETMLRAAGETIHTENSYKYDDAPLARLAGESCLSIDRA